MPVRELVVVDDDGGVADDLEQRLVATVTTGVPLAIASSTGRPKPS